MSFIQNPAVPYVGPLHGVSQGLLIHVTGQPSPNAKWFAVNLQCGPRTQPRDDMALHLMARFDGASSAVARNSLQAQQWGLEESFGHFPFVVGQPFELLVLVDAEHFKIAINGQHYTEFRFRLPVARVNTIAIDGDVQLRAVHFEGGGAGLPQHPQPMGGMAPQQHGAAYGAPSHPSSGHPTTGAYAAPHGAYGQQPMPHAAGGQYLPTQAPFTAYAAQPPAYGVPSGSAYLQPQTSSMPVPGYSPKSGRRSPNMGMMAGAAGVGAVGGYGANRLAYPHGGYGMTGGGMAQGKKGMKKNKMKKMKKQGHMGMGHGFTHKPKKHKFGGYKHKKKSGSSSSSSSSSSE